MKSILLPILITTSSITIAQNGVGINTDNSDPDASALLDVKSTTQGILIPRMLLAERNAIATPATGLLIYQTDGTAGFYYFNGTIWTPFISVGAAGWETNGNAGTTNGTNFIGTTDAQAIDIRTNNVIKVRFTEIGQLEILNTNSSILIGEDAGKKHNIGVSDNIFIGRSAGENNEFGSNNIGIGNYSMLNAFFGSNNTAVGHSALNNNDSGDNNSAFGNSALSSTSFGFNNTAMGTSSLSLTNGDNNSAFGYQALWKNNGFDNTALGANAMSSSGSAAFSVALGNNALEDVTNGIENVAIGNSSLSSNLTGTGNTAIGNNSGHSALGDANVFIGFLAGFNETGSNKLYISNSNTASPLIYGDFASSRLNVNGNLGINTTNTAPDASAQLDVRSTTKGMLTPRMTEVQKNAIATPATGLIIYQTDASDGFYYYDGTAWVTFGGGGGSTGGWETTGNAGTTNGTNFIGTTDAQAVDFRTNNVLKARLTEKGQFEFLNTGNSVFIGEGAGANDDLTDNRNIFMGYSSGAVNTTGRFNTAVGYRSLESNTTSTSNSAFGMSSLADNISGESNTAMGRGSLSSNVSGDGNCAFGAVALGDNLSNRNTAMGHEAMRFNTNGNHNCAIGYYSLRRNTAGNYNNAIGVGAMQFHQTGNGNVAIGGLSLNDHLNGSDNIAIGDNSLFENVNGNRNTTIGSNAGFENLGSDNVFIGNSAGYNELGSNKLYIANTNTTTPLIYGDFANNTLNVNGALGVNTTNAAPDASALLDLSSDSKGILIPRMLEAEKNVIVTPATGLMIYQTDGTQGFYYYDGTAWVTFGGGGGSSLWTDAGADSYLTSLTDNVGIGTTTPAEKLEVNGKVKSDNARQMTSANGTISTTSTSFVLVAGMTSTFTSGDNMPVMIQAYVPDVRRIASGSATLRLLIDGVEKQQVRAQESDGTTNVSLMHLEVMSAGSHTVTVEWLSSNGGTVSSFATGNRQIIIWE